MRRYAEVVKCSGPSCPCPDPSRAWDADPSPIDVEIDQPPGHLFVYALDFGPTMAHAALLDALGPELPDVVQGRVEFAGPDGLAHLTDHRTFWAPYDRRVQTMRSRYSRHFVSPCCGRIGNLIHWAGDSVVERTIDGRRVFLDQHGMIVVEPARLRELRLRKRFPDLRTQIVPVVPEPLDGETLPGDPGWRGVFVPNPAKLRVTKEERPKRGHRGLE